MMNLKNLFFLSILCSLVLFTNCGESDDPVADTPANNTDDGSTNPVTFTLTIKEYQGGTVTPALGTHTYNEGDSVELLATPDSTHTFAFWNDESSDNFNNPLAVVMNANKTIIPVFSIKQYPLIIIVEGEGAVSEEIMANGRVEDYVVGTLVQLTATPSEGWKFDKWVELDVDTNPLEVSITDSVTLTARFYVPIDSISITPSALKLAPGESGTLTANILPSNATDTTFAWTSSNETIATIDQLGIVTAITAGETTITAVSNEGGIEAVASVTVATPVTGLTINPQSKEINIERCLSR